jgi:hypothetical protein
MKQVKKGWKVIHGQKKQEVTLPIEATPGITQHTTLKQQIVQGTRSTWTRNLYCVTDQLGIDFPRFANKCFFGYHMPTEELIEYYSQNDTPTSHVLDSQMLPDNFEVLSHEQLQKLPSNEQRQKYHMKLVLLLFAKLFEGPDSAAENYIRSKFDEFFMDSADLGLACCSFIEKAFLPGTNQDFSRATRALNVMRTVTQGHFAPAVTVFQEKLGISNIVANIRHMIFVSVPRNQEENVCIYHLKSECADWGALSWQLSCEADNYALDLLRVGFEIHELQINVSFKYHLLQTKKSNSEN